VCVDGGGEQVTVTVFRGQRRLDIKVTLGDATGNTSDLGQMT
jgi:S1-C subfamily serine protease